MSSISGGNFDSSYQYYWYNSGTDEIVGEGSSINVPAGGYYVVAIDGSGCQGTDEVSVEQPNQLTYSVTKDDIDCYGGNDGKFKSKLQEEEQLHISSIG